MLHLVIKMFLLDLYLPLACFYLLLKIYFALKSSTFSLDGNYQRNSLLKINMLFHFMHSLH
jgi:hypothetical protein